MLATILLLACLLDPSVLGCTSWEFKDHTVIYAVNPEVNVCEITKYESDGEKVNVMICNPTFLFIGDT